MQIRANLQVNQASGDERKGLLDVTSSAERKRAVAASYDLPAGQDVEFRTGDIVDIRDLIVVPSNCVVEVVLNGGIERHTVEGIFMVLGTHVTALTLRAPSGGSASILVSGE